MAEKGANDLEQFHGSFPRMSSLYRRSPRDVLHDHAKRSVPQPKFSASKTVDYSQVKSRCGAVNTSHKPGGGEKKIVKQKSDYSGVEPRTSSRHADYEAGGGKVKVVSKPVKFHHIPSRTDSGKPGQKRLSDTTPYTCRTSTGASPTSSLQASAAQSKSASSSPVSHRRIEGQLFSMPVLDHEKIQERIKKLSLGADSVELRTTRSPSASPSAVRKVSGSSPLLQRKHMRKTSGGEKPPVKLPLGLRRYASPASSLQRPKDETDGRRPIRRQTSVDSLRLQQNRQQNASRESSVASSSSTKPRLRKIGSASAILSPTGSLSTSRSFDENTHRDWVKGQDDEPVQRPSASDLVFDFAPMSVTDSPGGDAATPVQDEHSLALSAVAETEIENAPLSPINEGKTEPDGRSLDAAEQ